MGYDDLRSYLKVLKEKSLLNVIKSKICKDTELMSVARWQFRGLPVDQRKGFLFENITDLKGNQYKTKVVAGVISSNRRMCAETIGVEENELNAAFLQGLNNPIKPQMVANGPCQEVVMNQEEVDAEGLDRFPIPISTPGFDPAPYFTAPFWVTKDLNTGIRNVGTYRGHVKGTNRVGISLLPNSGVSLHYAIAKAKGVPLEAAIVIGGPPVLGMVASSKIPHGVDEYDIAGGLMGKPVDLVKCETIDMEVPATSEIVLEGELTTDYREMEGPFGEFTGYNGKTQWMPVFKIKRITHRIDPIFLAFIGGFPPAECSTIRALGHEINIYKALKPTNPSLQEVCLHETGGSWGYIALKIKKLNPWESKQILYAAAGFASTLGKIIVAVDDDIDPRDLESINWAMVFRTQPSKDFQFINGRVSMLDPSSAPPGTPTPQQRYPGYTGTEAVLIDATRKWDYAPVSLPEKKYAERAMEIWKKEGLPELNPKKPWYGYNLGCWSEDEARWAAAAMEGKYHETAEELLSKGVKD